MSAKRTKMASSVQPFDALFGIQHGDDDWGLGSSGIPVCCLVALPGGQSYACPIHAACLVTMATYFLRRSPIVGNDQINMLSVSDQLCSNEGAGHRDVMIHALIGLLWDFLY